MRLLIVDDDPFALDFLGRLLEADHRVVRCNGGAEALAALDGEAFDLLITDLGMPEPDGFALLGAAQERVPPLPVIVLTAADDARAAVRALKLGARDYLLKPATPGEVRAAVGGAGGAQDAEAADTSDAFGLIGASPVMRELRRLVPLLARSRASVLLQGETGTGKEVAARALHDQGPRAAGAFVAHNMAATPPDLAESLFFGHMKGAFSGAAADHPGLFEQAQGGTLFLDEVDSFPLPLQAKLLRALESERVRRVGAAADRAVDVRVIAATAADLEALVARGGFRADLYYRLRQLELLLPPLRERRTDIPLLVTHFVAELGQGTGLCPRVAPAALERLLGHDWPGNVRELRNAVRSAAVLAEGGVILPGHLTGAITRSTPRRARAADGPVALRDVEHAHIRRVLEGVGGNQSEAARLLGIDRGTLVRKLRAGDGADGAGGR